MKRSFLQNASANVLQIIINQFFGLVVFYILSTQLSKAEFGEANWSLAVLLTAFNILSFGIDKLMIRKIAASEDASKALSLFIFHVVFTGVIFYGLLIILQQINPGFFNRHSILLLLGIGKLLYFFSTPFKQLASGLEKFNLLLYMSVPSNIIKGLALTWLAFTNQLYLQNAIIVFIAGDLIELLISITVFIFFLKMPFTFKVNSTAYLHLLKETLPQLGTVLFSSALARFDWIFIGLFLSAAKLAEYSFAYKVFEMSILPLLVIAPVLIPLFTRMFKAGKEISENKDLLFLLKLELIVASLIALFINLSWTPVIDQLTSGKYGSVNTNTIFILTLSMPVLYLNNFLWTILFSKGKLKTVFRIFAVAFFLNLCGDIILIPLLRNEGAALAFFLAVFVQTILYLRQVNERILIDWQPLTIPSVCAICSGVLANKIFLSQWTALSFAATFYLFLLLLTMQLKKSDWGSFKRVLQL